MNYTHIMNKHHWLAKKYIKGYFYNLKLNRDEIYKTQSMMYDDRFIIIIKFTGSRFNYSLIDFEKEKILCACQPCNILIENLKRLAKG